MYITKKGFVIDKKKINLNILNCIKNELTIAPIIPDEFSKDLKPYPIYHENEETITIPRYYGVSQFGEVEKKFKSKKTKFSFIGNMRPHQNDIINNILPKIKKTGGGLISLPCGAGKTVISLNLAQKLGYKTLVLVHKTFLQDQWIARATEFTNAKIGFIRQSNVDINGKDIVIGMIQSISMKSYDPTIFNDFGLVIVDECHHIASRVFSQALYKTGCIYTIGLSATPKRVDGLTKVIYWYLGKMLYKEERKSDNNVIVQKLNLQLSDPLFIEKTLWVKGKIVPAIPKMITNLSKINRRNQIIIDIIDTLRKNTKRKILILSGRINHLEYLKHEVDELIQKDINSGKMIQEECKTAFYIGKMNSSKRKEAEDIGDILFASYEMAHEGLDINRLDTVILVTPKKNVVQAIGRIMRKIITKNDLKPLIIDLTDDLSIFNRQGEVRYNLYKKNNYCIYEFMINDEYQIPLKLYNNAKHKFRKEDNILIKKIFDENEMIAIPNNDNNEHNERNKHTKDVKFSKNAFNVCLMD